MSFSNEDYPARKYTLTKTQLKKVPEEVRANANSLLPVTSVRVGHLSWEVFEKACKDGSFGGLDAGVEGDSLLYCYVVLVTDIIRVLFVHCHPDTITLEPELVRGKVRALLDNEESGALLMQYSLEAGNNRTLQSPEEIFLNPRLVSSDFPVGMGAIKDLAFRRLVATEDGWVIRPPESLWDHDYLSIHVLPRVTIGDELHAPPDRERIRFDRSIEPIVLEPFEPPNDKPTGNNFENEENDPTKEDNNNIGESGGDEKATENIDDLDEDEPPQNKVFGPKPNDYDEIVEVESSDKKAGDKSNVFNRLGPRVDHPAKESTPVNATASSSTGTGAAMPRTSSRGKLHAGHKGHTRFPPDSGALSDDGIMDWYSNVVDDNCPIDDEAVGSLFKADKIKRKFLEACSDRLTAAQSRESETASKLQLSLAELMAKQAEGQAQAEAEANIYRHIARNLKDEEMAEARMDYDMAVSHIAMDYEQTMLATTTHYGRKRAKVVADTKQALKALFDNKIKEMIQSRAELVEVLRREESAVNTMIQELRDEAITDRSRSAGWLAQVFEAISALRGMYLPPKPWDTLDALLNSKPSLSDSLYAALGGEYQLNRPGPNLDLSIEDDDSTTAKKLQALMTAIHTRECVEPTPAPKKKQTMPTKFSPGKATRSKQQQQPKEKPLAAQTAENAKKVLDMTLEAKRVAYDADDKLLKYVRNRAYPNYSFADITRYYSDETKLVAEILAEANQKNRTLLSREEFMERSGLSLEGMKALIKTTVKRDYQATGRTRKHILKMTAGAVASSGDDDDIEPEGVQDPHTLEEKEDMIQYLLVIEKNHQHGDMDGLLDIHSRAALGRISVASGDSLKVATCPWCGYTTQNVGSTCAHTRKNHEGMLVVCGGCYAYASFRPDSVALHWANCPPLGDD